MLSRSAFSIRRLISQRRPRDVGGDWDVECVVDHDHDHDHEQDHKRTHYHGHGSSCDEVDCLKMEYSMEKNSRPWITTRGSKTRPVPKPIVILRRSGSIHTISGPLPPLPDTPYSSASSLCSCDCREPTTPGRLPGNRSPGLCSIRSRTTEEKSHSSPTPDRHDGLLSPRSIPTRKDDMDTESNPATGSTLNLLEALALEPDDNSPRLSPERQATPRLRALPEGTQQQRQQQQQQQQQRQEWSENVQQLIRETDEAFKAVGFALADSRVPSQDFSPSSVPSPCSPTFTRPRKAPLPSPPAAVSKEPPKLLPLVLTKPARKSSASKVKRRKSKKARRREQVQTRKPGSRWTLTDNVSELFNGRLFNRIEAEEMLTPSQLQEIRQNRISRLQPIQPRRSTETLRTIETDGSDTPIEPFHLQDLPTRIGAAGVRLTVPSPIEEVFTPGPFGNSQKRTVQTSLPSSDGKGDAPHQQPLQSSAQGEAGDSMTFDEVSFPVPPMKNPLRFIPRKQLPPLPTIPEVIVSDPDNTLVTRAVIDGSHDDGEEELDVDGFVYFKSTAFTVTMPTFRHGRIRVARESEPERRLAADDTLDWTAFQMAILGGAGDFFSDSVDYGRATDADAGEAAELARWFASLGLESAGRLVPEGQQEDDYYPTPTRMTVTTSTTTTPLACPPSPATAEYSPVSSAGSSASELPPSSATVRQEMVMVQSLPIPVDSEHPSGFWNEGAFNAGRFYAGRDLGIRRWTVEGHPKRYDRGSGGDDAGEGGGASGNNGDETNRESVESLPQSPMLDLVVSRGTDGEEYVVPMGYNLGHDLGDFLKWEAENVYASGFTLE